jgi:hypothetical protein
VPSESSAERLAYAEIERMRHGKLRGSNVRGRGRNATSSGIVKTAFDESKRKPVVANVTNNCKVLCTALYLKTKFE